MAILLKEQLKQLLEGVHYHAPFINVIKKGKEDPETLKNSRQIFYDFYAMEMMHSLFSEPEDSDKYKPEYIDGLKLTPKQKLKAQTLYNMVGGIPLLTTHMDNIILSPGGIQVVPQAFRNIVDNVYQEVVIQTAKKILAHLRLTLISEFRHLIDKADSWARFRRKLISIYNKKGIITQDDFENAIQTYIPGMAKHTDSIKRLLFFCKYYDEMYPDPADLISKSPEVGGIPGLKSKKRREPGEEPEFSPELDKPIDADGEKETEPSPELDKPIDTDGESDDVDIDEPMTKVPSGAEMDTSPYKYQKEIDLLKLKQYFDKLKKDKNKKKLQEAKYDASYAAGKIHPGTVLIIKKAIQKSGLKWEDILLAYKHIDWNASFGGPRWGEGVDAYLRLDANTRKHNFKEMVSDIDHIYDLEHNTGAFLNKGGMYVKTKDLDRRAKITRLSQFIPDVSPIIKQIIIRALKYSTKYPEIEQDIYGPHKMEYIPFTSEEEEVLKSFGFTRTVDNNIWNVGTSYRDKNGKRVLNPIAIKHLANGKYVIYDLINTELEIFETWDEFKTWFKENSKRFERGGYASGLVAKTQKGSNPSSTSKSPVTTKPPGIVTHQVLYPLSSEESEQLEKLDNKKDNIGFKIDSKGISKFGTFLFGNFYTTLIVCKIHPTHNTEKYYVVHYSDVGINTWEFSTWSQTLMFVKSNFSKLTKYKELDIDALNIPSPTLDLKAESLPPHSPSKATYKAHIGIDKPPIHTIRLTAEDEQYLFIYGFHPKMEGENIYYLHEVIQDKIKFYPNNTALISFSSMHPSNNTIKKSIEDTLAWIKLGYQPINQSKVKPEEKPEIKPEINPEEKPKIKYTNGFKLSSMYENMLSQKGFNWSPSSTMYINSSNGDAIYVQQNLKSIYSDGETGETSLFNSLPELAVFLKKYDELKKKVVSKQEFISEQEFIAELKKYGFDLMPSNKEESSKDKIFTFHNQIKGDTVVYSKINGKLFYVDASSSDKKEFKDFNQILDYIKNNIIHVTEIYSNNLNDSEIRYIDNIAEKNNLIFKNSIIPGTTFNQIILKNIKGVHLYTITKKDNTYYLYHINSTDGNPNVKILKEEKKWFDFIAYINGEFSAYKSNSYTIPGITPSEFKTIKKELLKEDEHIWLEYYSGDSGGPAYAIVYYRQDEYKPSDIIFGIHSDVKGYYIYGPLNKKEEYAMTFEELMVKVKNRASKIKSYQPVTRDNKKLILNIAKKHGFEIHPYSDTGSYILRKNNTYISISKAGITYEVVGIFNSITQFDTPRFINWFKNIYPSKIFPQTTKQLINNIINLLKDEINPKTMSLISKKHIIYAVKKLTEYIHKITGAPCGLQNCKIAIENFKLFLEYIEKHGLPNMDKDASNLTIIKNELALTKPKINMDFTTAEFTEEEKQAFDKLFDKHDYSFIQYAIENIECKISIKYGVVRYRLTKEDNAYCLYSEWNGLWKKEFSVDSFQTFLLYIDKFLFDIFDEFKNIEDKTVTKNISPSIDKNKLSVLEVSILKQIIKQFKGLKIGVHYNKLVNESLKNDAYGISISYIRNFDFFRIVKENSIYIFYRSIKGNYIPVKKFFNFLDLVLFVDFYFKFYLQKESLLTISDNEVEQIKDLIKEYNIKAEVRRYAGADMEGTFKYYVYIEMEDVIGKYILQKNDAGKYMLHVENIAEEWRRIGIYNTWSLVFKKLQQLLNPKMNQIEKFVLSSSQIGWLKSLIQKEKSTVHLMLQEDGSIIIYSETGIKLFEIRFSEKNEKERILVIYNKEETSYNQFQFNSTSEILTYISENIGLLINSLNEKPPDNLPDEKPTRHLSAIDIKEIDLKKELYEVFKKTGFTFYVDLFDVEDLKTGDGKDADIYINFYKDEVYLYEDGTAQIKYKPAESDKLLKQNFNNIKELIDWLKIYYKDKAIGSLEEFFKYLNYSKDVSLSNKNREVWKKQIEQGNLKNLDIVIINYKGQIKVHPAQSPNDLSGQKNEFTFESIQSFKDYLSDKYILGKEHLKKKAVGFLNMFDFKKIQDVSTGTKWKSDKHKLNVILFSEGGIVETYPGVEPHIKVSFENTFDLVKYIRKFIVPQKSIDIPSYIEINPKANYSEEFGSLYYPDKNILTLILNSNFKEVKITGGFQWVHPNGFSFKIYENAIEWDSIIEKKACLANKRFHRIYFLKALKEVDKNTDINKLDFLFEDASTRTSDYIMDKMMVEAAKDEGEDIKRTTIGNLIEKKDFKWNSDENYWYNINLKQIVVSKSNDKDEILFKVYWFKNGNYYISRFNEVQLLKSIGFDGDIIKGIINTEEEKEEDTPENNFLKIKGIQLSPGVHETLINLDFKFNSSNGIYFKHKIFKVNSTKNVNREILFKWDGEIYYVLYPYIINQDITYKEFSTKHVYDALDFVIKIEKLKLNEEVIQTVEEALKKKDAPFFNAPVVWLAFSPYMETPNYNNVTPTTEIDNSLKNFGFVWNDKFKMYRRKATGGETGIYWQAIRFDKDKYGVYFYHDAQGETRYFISTDFKEILQKIEEVSKLTEKELKTNLPTSLDSSHLPTSLDSSHYPSASLDKLTASTDIGTPIKLLDQDHEIVLNEGFEFNSKDFTYRNLKTRDEFKIYDSGYVRYKIKGVGEGINNIKFIFNILQHKYGIFEKGHGSFSIIQRLEEEGYKSNKHSYESKNLYFEKFLDKAGSIKLKAVVVVQSNYRTSYFLYDVTSVETIIGHRHFKHIKDMYPLIGMEESILMYISTALEKELKDEGYNINHKLPSYVYSFSNDKFVKFIKFKGNGSATFALVEFKSNGKEEFKEKINFQNYYEAITWIKQPTMDAGLSKTDKKHNINVSMEDISDIKDNFKKEFSYYDYGGWAKNTSHSPDSTIRLINKDESLMKKIGFSLNKDENNVYYYFNKEDIKVFFFVDGHAEIIRNNGELTNFPTIEKAIFNLWEQFYIKKMKEDAELLPIIDNFNVKLSESKEQILKSLGFNLVEKDGSIYYVKSNWEITFYRNGYTCIRDLKTGKIINSFYTHDEAIDYLKNNLK
ncbi:MAG TPA: hypothetical protein PLC59_02055 [Bacteroidales bacterium]|nr:hypothetical protein [Bacteroidales bacterium]